MSDARETAAAIDRGRRLADAIRDVRNAVADRDDVVVDMREAQRMRLELLAAELAPVFNDVPSDNDWFDFALSSGLQPRLWIDAVSHVSMGRDRRTYRFLRDTRLGRVVLAESAEMRPVADQVTRYVAERVVERQRLLEGEVEPVGAILPGVAPKPEIITQPAASTGRRWQAFWSGLGLVVAGGLVGLILVVAAALLWGQLAALGV
jgi:hypothetical protein